MPGFLGLQRFFGGTVANTAAYSAGGAIQRVLHPQLQSLANEGWSLHPDMPVNAGTLAAGVAQGQVPYDWAVDEAKRTGFNQERFDHLVAIANVGPGVGEAFNLWRRGVIDEPGFRRAVKRLGLEKEWIDALVQVHDVLLSFSDVANAIQQGHLPNPGILPDISAAVEVAGGAVSAVAPDGQPPSSVPLTQIDLDPLAIIAGLGYTPDDLRVQANLAGLPPGPEALLTMWNRELIDEESVDAGIREGHMKTKWAGAFKRMRWAVLSGQEYAEARLRDWITDQEMYEGGALTGHTKAQMDLFYRNRGRPATPRQVWLGWARKIIAPDYPGDPANGRLTGLKDHELAIRRSNIRPEYAKLLWDVRFNYVPVFQLNRLVAAKVIDADTAADWAHKNLVAPEVVEKLREFWLKPATTAQKEATAADLLALYDGDKATLPDTLEALEALGYPPDEAQAKIDVLEARRVSSARTTAVSDLHGAYKKGEISNAAALAALAALGLSTDGATDIVASWQAYLTAAGDAPPV